MFAFIITLVQCTSILSRSVNNLQSWQPNFSFRRNMNDNFGIIPMELWNSPDNIYNFGNDMSPSALNTRYLSDYEINKRKDVADSFRNIDSMTENIDGSNSFNHNNRFAGLSPVEIKRVDPKDMRTMEMRKIKHDDKKDAQRGIEHQAPEMENIGELKNEHEIDTEYRSFPMNKANKINNFNKMNSGIENRLKRIDGPAEVHNVQKMQEHLLDNLLSYLINVLKDNSQIQKYDVGVNGKKCCHSSHFQIFILNDEENNVTKNQNNRKQITQRHADTNVLNGTPLQSDYRRSDSEIKPTNRNPDDPEILERSGIISIDDSTTISYSSLTDIVDHKYDNSRRSSAIHEDQSVPTVKDNETQSTNINGNQNSTYFKSKSADKVSDTDNISEFTGVVDKTKPANTSAISEATKDNIVLKTLSRAEDNTAIGQDALVTENKLGKPKHVENNRRTSPDNAEIEFDKNHVTITTKHLGSNDTDTGSNFEKNVIINLNINVS